MFIAMPSRKASDGEYRDIAHPINSETRDKIQSLILEKYQEVASESEVKSKIARAVASATCPNFFKISKET